MKSDRNPTTTAAPARVRLFQPTQKPKLLTNQLIETQFGELIVTGRIGQRHADLYESILKFSRPFVDPQTNQFAVNEVIVEPAQLRRVLSADQYSAEQLWRLARELVKADVEIRTATIEAVGHLINEIRRGSHVDAECGGALDGVQKKYWRVSLGAVAQEFLRVDIRRYYDPAKVARLTTGIGQAVARWILTHRRDSQPVGGWKIDTTIEGVYGPIPPMKMAKRRHELRSDASGLAALGIILDRDRIAVMARNQDADAREDGG